VVLLAEMIDRVNVGC